MDFLKSSPLEKLFSCKLLWLLGRSFDCLNASLWHHQLGANPRTLYLTDGILQAAIGRIDAWPRYLILAKREFFANFLQVSA